MKRRSFLTTPRRGGGLVSSLKPLLAILLFLIVFILTFLRLLFPGALTTLVLPFWSLGTSLTDTVGKVEPLASREELADEREALRREVEVLQIQNATLAARAADLERLLGGRTERVAGVLAGVLARPPVAPYDVLILDQGTTSNVVVGVGVYGPGGVPLGTVTEASARTSRATLYSSTGQVTEAWTGELRIPLKLTGTGAGGFDTEVPGTAGAVVGDPVFVPGPGSIPIGVVSEIVSDPSSPTVLLRIRPHVNPFSLTWVTIGV